MSDWNSKKFHYKIINISDKRKVIGYIHKKLTELEAFFKQSGLSIKKLERTGPNDFIVEVTSESDWIL